MLISLTKAGQVLSLCWPMLSSKLYGDQRPQLNNLNAEMSSTIDSFAGASLLMTHHLYAAVCVGMWE